MQLLTNSRQKSARACQRLHKLEYVDLWRPAEEAEPLRFGTLLHLGLGAWWLAAEERLLAAFQAMEGESDAFERVKAEEMLRGYDARWADEAATFEVLAVEREFNMELRNPETGAPSRTWRLAGKLDLVLRHIPTSRQLLGEHKSSTEDISPGSEYWRRLRMDGQVSQYYLGGDSLGFDIEGCLYDVLAKPALRPLKATPADVRKYTKAGALYANQREEDETPDEYRLRVREAIATAPERYYQRGEVVRLEEEMRDAQYDTWQLAKQIREAELAGRAPRNPDACVRYGRTCPFFGVCTGEESLADNPRFTRSTPHPELAGNAEVSKEETATCQSQPHSS